MFRHVSPLLQGLLLHSLISGSIEKKLSHNQAQIVYRREVKKLRLKIFRELLPSVALGLVEKTLTDGGYSSMIVYYSDIRTFVHKSYNNVQSVRPAQQGLQVTAMSCKH